MTDEESIVLDLAHRIRGCMFSEASAQNLTNIKKLFSKNPKHVPPCTHYNWENEPSRHDVALLYFSVRDTCKMNFFLPNMPEIKALMESLLNDWDEYMPDRIFPSHNIPTEMRQFYFEIRNLPETVL